MICQTILGHFFKLKHSSTSVAYEVGYDELFLLLGSSMEKDILDHSTYFVHSCVEYVEIL
jgi:hypothetical protein